jgi:hypothetical protein
MYTALFQTSAPGQQMQNSNPRLKSRTHSSNEEIFSNVWKLIPDLQNGHKWRRCSH